MEFKKEFSYLNKTKLNINKYKTYYQKNFREKKEEAILEQVNKSNKFENDNLFVKGNNLYYATNMKFHNKKLNNKNKLNIIDENINNKLREKEIMSVLRQNRYCNRPLSSKVQKRDLLKNNLEQNRPPSRLQKGIKVEENKIPIKNMFGAYDPFHDTDKIYNNNNNNIIMNKNYETDYKEMIKFKENKNNNRMSAKVKLPFESKLSPDFLNLFSK